MVAPDGHCIQALDDGKSAAGDVVVHLPAAIAILCNVHSAAALWAKVVYEIPGSHNLKASDTILRFEQMNHIHGSHKFEASDTVTRIKEGMSRGEDRCNMKMLEWACQAACRFLGCGRAAELDCSSFLPRGSHSTMEVNAPRQHIMLHNSPRQTA